MFYSKLETKDLFKYIMKTRLLKLIENFTNKTMKTFKWKIPVVYVSVQNIDCGYLLEPPLRGGSNEYHNLCFLAEIRKLMYTFVNRSFIA